MQDVQSIKTEIFSKLKSSFGTTLKNATPEQIYKACALCVRDELAEKWVDSNARADALGKKRLFYMSAEFLMGRALACNMINMGMLGAYREALGELGIQLEAVEEQEPDAGLGNGGLGRLAACFLDSLASLGLPATGCGIRYEYGLFKQRILDGEQVEVEDNWLADGYAWEIPRPEEQVEVRFGGNIEERWESDGLKIKHTDYYSVYAVPYDVPIAGYMSDMPATLRLWSAKAVSRLDLKYFNRGDYLRAMQEKELAEVISKVLYPEDNHEQGKQLRLKQFYFFTSATMQYMVKRHKALYGNLHTLPDYAVVQINDTHPTLAIPELMRILIDEEGFSWEDAYDVCTRVFNYTNHTVMSEALERWSADMFSKLLPRVYRIIETINEKFCRSLADTFHSDFDRISDMAIIAYGEIRMANLCTAVCGHVNGVSKLHGQILKTRVFRDFYVVFPQKFSGITNGITHRRWLAAANPLLTELIKSKIGDGFLGDSEKLGDLKKYVGDADFISEFARIKQANKKRFADYIFETQGIKLLENAIFDVQAKRMHEYKRQLLKVLQILSLYNDIIADPDKKRTPCVFLFAAKASPGYTKAKNIIRLINSVSALIESDERTRGLLQVVFVENYGVSIAEKLIPAADISEQLSTAGREASGTGNMKFMMNGAITIGTMDGANVEISEAVGRENMFIFGAGAEDIHYMETYRTYKPADVLAKNNALRGAMNRLMDGSLPAAHDKQFADIYHSLLFGDYDGADKYFVLYDFASYCDAFNRAIELYEKDRDGWNSMAAYNTACSGVFSSDRTISEYNREIWRLERL